MFTAWLESRLQCGETRFTVNSLCAETGENDAVGRQAQFARGIDGEGLAQDGLRQSHLVQFDNVQIHGEWQPRPLHLLRCRVGRKFRLTGNEHIGHNQARYVQAAVDQFKRAPLELNGIRSKPFAVHVFHSQSLQTEPLDQVAGDTVDADRGAAPA